MGALHLSSMITTQATQHRSLKCTSSISHKGMAKTSSVLDLWHLGCFDHLGVLLLCMGVIAQLLDIE
jgi:hypothetical protein